MALLWAASMGVAAAMADGPLRDALERGILAHALDSRVESARPTSLAGVVRHSQWHHAGPRGRGVLSFSYLSSRIPSLFCAQPWDSEWSCAAFDVVLLFEAAGALAPGAACSVSTHDAVGCSCGCAGASPIAACDVEWANRTYANTSGCVAKTAAALEASVRAFRDRAAKHGDVCETGGLYHNELQFAAAPPLYAALNGSLVGVAVVVARNRDGRWVPGSARRVRRARAFSRWLAGLDGVAAPPPVWTFSLDGRVGDAKRLPDVYHSPFRAHAALASDFRGEPLPMASCWGVYANGTAPWAPAVADPPDGDFDAALRGAGVVVVAFDSLARSTRPASFGALLRVAAWGAPRLLSASLVSDAAPNAFCAQPLFDDEACGANDLLLLFEATDALLDLSCSFTVHDSCGRTCGCAGAPRVPDDGAACLDVRGDWKNATRRARDALPSLARVPTCPPDRHHPRPGFYSSLLHNELQFPGDDDAVFRALEAAFLGVGVVDVVGDPATAKRRERARAFRDWLADDFFFGADLDLWEYAIDAAVGHARETPARIKSAFAAATVAADFQGRSLPQASYWGYYVPDGRHADPWRRVT